MRLQPSNTPIGLVVVDEATAGTQPPATLPAGEEDATLSQTLHRLTKGPAANSLRRRLIPAATIEAAERPPHTTRQLWPVGPTVRVAANCRRLRCELQRMAKRVQRSIARTAAQHR